jgi:hypothetical protein
MVSGSIFWFLVFSLVLVLKSEICDLQFEFPSSAKSASSSDGCTADPQITQITQMISNRLNTQRKTLNANAEGKR